MKKKRQPMDSAAQHGKFKLVAIALDCKASEYTLDSGLCCIFAAGARKQQEPYATTGTDPTVNASQS